MTLRHSRRTATYILDLTAAKTLDIAQSLYEKKLISYPRTGSRYIPHDVMAAYPVCWKR